MEEDLKRDTYFAAEGYRVMRFHNAEVVANLDGLLSAIAQALNAHPQPLPPAGGEKQKP